MKFAIRSTVRVTLFNGLRMSSRRDAGHSLEPHRKMALTLEITYQPRSWPVWARFLYSDGATSKYLLKWSIKFFLAP